MYKNRNFNGIFRILVKYTIKCYIIRVYSLKFLVNREYGGIAMRIIVKEDVLR